MRVNGSIIENVKFSNNEQFQLPKHLLKKDYTKKAESIIQLTEL